MIRNVVVGVATAVVAIAITNQMKSKQAVRDLWAEAADPIDPPVSPVQHAPVEQADHVG